MLLGRLPWADICRQRQEPEPNSLRPTALFSEAFWSRCRELAEAERNLSTSCTEDLREVSLYTHHLNGTGFSLKELGWMPRRPRRHSEVALCCADSLVRAQRLSIVMSVYHLILTHTQPSSALLREYPPKSWRGRCVLRALQ